MSGFRYLISDAVSLENVDEAEALRNTLDAMTIVGLSQAEQVCALFPTPATGSHGPPNAILFLLNSYGSALWRRWQTHVS